MISRGNALWLAIAAVAVTGVACSGGPNGSTPKPGAQITNFYPPRYPGLVSPTPADRGPVYLDEVNTPDHLATFSAGKCVGFTVTSDPAKGGPTFGIGATVELGPYGIVPSRWVDPYHVRVGSDETGGTCIFTHYWDPAGVWDVDVVDGSTSTKLTGAVVMTPPKFLDIGSVAHDRVYAADKVLDAGAQEFEVPYDVDLYRVTFGNGFYNVYDHADFFPTGADALVPELQIWHPVTATVKTDELLARGGRAVIFPEGGTMIVEVKDLNGQGHPGATYDIGFIGDELASTSTGDTCLAPPAIELNKGYHVDYDSLTAKMDPAGACADSLYGSPIKTPGNDAVWTVTVPAHQELRASGYDDHIDNALYLLPMTDVMTTSTNGCPVRPTNCVAAASHYGGGNTDVMIYDNLSDADQQFLLVSDSATVMTNTVGSFLVNVEAFPLPLK